MESPAFIYLAPFQGITGRVFRSCFSKYFNGIDKIFTPYFASINSNKKLSEKKAFELECTAENSIPVIPQILSKDPDEIIRFSKLIEEIGFSELNWNLGCPYPQVANKKRGSGMLPYPKMVDEILERVFDEINIKFSVKCRLGYSSADEIDDLINVFNNYPLRELIVHPRIGKQLYSGETDLNKFGFIVNKTNKLTEYNCDIFSLEHFLLLKQKFPSNTHFMIGRGLLSNPFLAAEIKGLDLPEDKINHLLKFITELYLAYRKKTNNSLSVIGFMKEYWNYLAECFPNSKYVLRKIKKVRNFDEYENAVWQIFESAKSEN